MKQIRNTVTQFFLLVITISQVQQVTLGSWVLAGVAIVGSFGIFAAANERGEK